MTVEELIVILQNAVGEGRGKWPVVIVGQPKAMPLKRVTKCTLSEEGDHPFAILMEGKVHATS